MRLELKKFDITSIDDDKVVVMIGKRNTGKSFLIKDLLYYNNHFQLGTVISGTESANHFYRAMVPKMFIHDEFTDRVVENVVKRQKHVLKKKDEEERTYGQSSIDPKSFLILDDCLYDSSWTKNVNIRALFMNGRHLKMFFIISMQYPLGITPNLRTNIDYVFILRENIVANRKLIYDNYAGMFPTFEVFCQVMDQCTENFECLVINNTTKSNKLEENVFWYKASTHPPFKICNQTFWDMANNMNYDERNEETFDSKSFASKRKHVINVKKMNAR